MTQTERTENGIHVVFDGIGGDVINEVGALMANVAETLGAMTAMSRQQSREEAEANVMQSILDNAWTRIHRKRCEREHMS